MTPTDPPSPGRLLEWRGDTIAILVRAGRHWEFHALDGRWSHFEGRAFATPVAAEHAVVRAAAKGSAPEAS